MFHSYKMILVYLFTMQIRQNTRIYYAIVVTIFTTILVVVSGQFPILREDDAKCSSAATWHSCDCELHRTSTTIAHQEYVQLDPQLTLLYAAVDSLFFIGRNFHISNESR